MSCSSQLRSLQTILPGNAKAVSSLIDCRAMCETEEALSERTLLRLNCRGKSGQTALIAAARQQSWMVVLDLSFESHITLRILCGELLLL